MKKLYTRL